MQKQHAISVYNASAGSGKTFALASNYLSILLRSSSSFKYRQILAITFTNKAVAEMKSRIIENLKDFAYGENLEQSAIFNTIQKNTGMTLDAIRIKSEQILHNIIQDYASFDVVTIDNFTHRIIRSFARDLKIPQNFEVELNTREVLERAVDNLIDRAGSDPLLTPVLLDYAIEKIDDDKSWDISRDFYDIARLLLSENDRYFIALLNERSLQDFAALKKGLKGKLAHWGKEIIQESYDLLDFIASKELLPEHFTGKYLPNALQKFSEGNFTFNPDSGWVKYMGEQPLYKKTQNQGIKDILDSHTSEITSLFSQITAKIIQLSLTQELLKKITPLSLLQAINKEVQQIKADKNLLLISDFNEVINKNIANQPTPFIYERLGERYQHYFIDEFQDTSILQWENLIPLIDNAVSTGERTEPSNSLMLVGDPKQAIYRWRGGYAEQFIKLSNGYNPFQNPDMVQVDLEYNYRSHEEIIAFNNLFFTETARFLEHPVYEDIYLKGNKQGKNHRTGGHVSISFIEAQTVEEGKEPYLDKTLEILQQTLARGYEKKDICILVRKNAEGILLAQYLQEKEIAVISSQSLLVSQSAEVRFIANLLRFMQHPDAQAISILLLEHLAKNHFDLEDPHDFYVKMLPKKGQELFDSLPLKAGTSETFKLQRCQQSPLYEAVEYVVQYFELNQNAGAYLQSFLDSVFDFGQKNDSGMHGFLDWWEKNQDVLSIGTPPNTEAVQIMTIHKAKGLEFPIVIYPFAESALYPGNDTTNWYPTNPADYAGFEALLISQKKGLLHLDDASAALYHEKRQQQQLDSLNMLYVALTRPVEELHIITRITEKVKPTEDPANFADLFVNYLHKTQQWEQGKLHYNFGRPINAKAIIEKSDNGKVLTLYSSPKEGHNLIIVTRAERLWDENRMESINKGNLLHDILAGIPNAGDIQAALKTAQNTGAIKQEDWASFKVQLDTVIGQLKLEGFFNEKHKVFNEREMVYEDDLLRPDRVELDDQQNAYLLDYKTGAPQASHHNQINTYAKALTAAGMNVVKKILVYVNEEQIIHLV